MPFVPSVPIFACMAVANGPSEAAREDPGPSCGSTAIWSFEAATLCDFFVVLTGLECMCLY